MARARLPLPAAKEATRLNKYGTVTGARDPPCASPLAPRRGKPSPFETEIRDLERVQFETLKLIGCI